MTTSVLNQTPASLAFSSLQTRCAYIARCDVISSEADGDDVVVRWRLSGRVNLPFKPPIKPYVVTTTFTRDAGAFEAERGRCHERGAKTVHCTEML